MADWILGIDFGTSYTSAAARVNDRAEIIEVDGDRRVPSIILLGQADELVVGKAAENQAPLYPNRIVREPKRLVGEPAPVIVGGKPYPVVRLVGAVLEHVYTRAVEHQGGPPAEVRLTHPATWRRPRVKALGEAAAIAGILVPRFIPEPVAAAIAYGTEGGVLPEDAHVAIYDLGGGTFDTAVLRAVDGEFVVVGRPGGDPRLGGEFFDELLANHLGTRLPPNAWHSLQVSDDLVWRQAHAAFRTEVRRAKEALSLQPLAELLVALPAGLERLAISREEFEGLVRPYLLETADMLGTTIADAGVPVPELAAIYLVGGASRIPLAERLLREAFPSVPISRRGDPKMVVALGATHATAGASLVAAITPPTDVAVGAVAAGMAPTPRGIAGTSVDSATQSSGDPPPQQTYHDPGPQPPPASPPTRRRLVSRTAAIAVVALGLAGLVAGSVAALVMLNGAPSEETAVVTPPSERSSDPSPSRSERPSREASATATASATGGATPSATPIAAAQTIVPVSRTPAPVVRTTPRPPVVAPPTPVPTPVPATPVPPPAPVSASIVSPPGGSKLSGSSVTFTWTPVANARYYSLWAGSQPPPDPNDAFAYSDYGASSGMPPSQTSVTMSGLPSNGTTVYVRLFTKIEPDSGPLLWRDYTYSAAGG